MENKVVENGKRLFELRDKKEILEKELKEINKEKSHIEEQILPKLMEDSEIEKIKIEGYGTLYTQSSVRAYILVDNLLEAHKWLRDHGHGAIIKESVHHATLKAWTKEQLEEGKEVPEIFNAKPYTIARIRRT